MIGQCASHCSERIFKRLEETLWIYHDDWERDHFKYALETGRHGRYRTDNWGRGQNVLLVCLPSDRTSPTTKKRASVSRVLGFGSTSRQLRKLIDGQIDQLLREGKLVEDDGRITVSGDGQVASDGAAGG